MQRRNDIDGLRTVAVIPVILFHAGAGLFQGGYVGVDIFFVISGFLITTILLEDLASGRFSLLDFYERRCRRILPALFLVVALCVPVARMLMFPEQFNEFRQSVVGVGLFISNRVFWKQSGYFETETDLKPLLHTWSLSVEEQFYVLFPLFLWLAHRYFRPWLMVVLVAGIVVSLGLSEYEWRRSEGADFYLITYRAWELGIGALGAFCAGRYDIRPNNALSLLGLGMVAAAIVLFDAQTPMPSVWGLIPVGGTALIILFGGHGTLAGRLLSQPPMVSIGLVSYSAYLWHQPLFAFARLYLIDTPPPELMLALSAVALGLAYLTERFVERPFRDRRSSFYPRRAVLFAGSLAGLATLVLVGTIIPPGQDIERQVTLGDCNRDKKNCYDFEGAKGHVAIWGDSYADAFTPALASALRQQGLALDAYILHSCPSIIGVERNEDRRLGVMMRQECRHFGEQAVARIIAERPAYLVLTSAYEIYAGDSNEAGQPVLVTPGSASNPWDTVADNLARTIARFNAAGIPVVLVMPHPLVDDFERQRKMVARDLAPNIIPGVQRARRFSDYLLSRLQAASVTFTPVDGIRLLCGSDPACPIISSAGEFRLFDRGHISATEAPLFAQAVAEAGRPFVRP